MVASVHCQVFLILQLEPCFLHDNHRVLSFSFLFLLINHHLLFVQIGPVIFPHNYHHLLLASRCLWLLLPLLLLRRRLRRHSV